MKKFLSAIAVLCLTGGMVSTSLAASTVKIGVVDLPQIMQKSPQVAAINQKLQTQFGPQQQKIMNLQNQMRDESQKLAPNAPTKLSDADRKKVQENLASEQKQLQQMIEQFQSGVGAAQNKAMQDILAQISTVVKGVAQKQQLDLVMLKQALLYSDNTVDITNQVVGQLH